VSFKDFQKFLDSTDSKLDIKRDIYPKMKEIIFHSTTAVTSKINRNDRQFCYLVLGYDFMIDVSHNVVLIEINKNTGLAESSPIINMIMPRMMDDSLRLTIDDLFEPAYINNSATNYKSPYPVTDYSDYENMWEFMHKL